MPITNSQPTVEFDRLDAMAQLEQLNADREAFGYDDQQVIIEQRIEALEIAVQD